VRDHRLFFIRLIIYPKILAELWLREAQFIVNS